MGSNGYWGKFWQQRASRRALLRGGAAGAAGLAAAIALGCEEEEEKPAATATPAVSTPTVATATPTPEATATLEPEYASAKYGGVLIYDSDDEPSDLRPYITEHPASGRVQQITYNGLLRRWEQAEDPDKFGLIFTAPELASEWEQVDETTYRFSLVKNAKWHNLPPVNGRQLTAADIKYSFERMIDPTILESRTRSSLETVDSIETPDEFTVVFKLKFPFAPFLANASHGWAVIVPQELYETGEISQRAVGSYFVMKEWQRGVKVVWDRNPEYFRTGHPFIDGIILRHVPDRAARLANFRAGETDWWSGSPPQTPVEAFDEVAKGLGDKVRKIEYKTQTAVVAKIAFDTAHEPFNDIRLRHAFLYGLPYDIVIKLFGGYASRTGPLPPGNREWALRVEDLPPVDIAKAKALLAEAGYGPDNPLKVTSKVALYGGEGTSLIVQALVKPLGIEITIQKMEAGEWVAKIYSGKEPYQLTAHFDATFDDPDRRLFSYYHSKGAQNQTHYNNPEMDRLLDAQRRELDVEKRKDLVRQIQLILIDDAPEVWLVSPGGRSLERTWIHNRHLMLYYPITDRQYDNVWYDPVPPGRGA